MSALRFRLTYQACIVQLHVASLAMKGRTFNELGDSGKEELMDRLLTSRNPMIRDIPAHLSLPFLISQQQGGVLFIERSQEPALQEEDVRTPGENEGSSMPYGKSRRY